MNNIDGLFNRNGFDGIIVLVDDKLQIIDVNTEFESLLEYEKSKVIDTAFTEYILPDEKSYFFDLLYKNDKNHDKTLRLYHGSGAFRYFSVSVYQFKDTKLIFGKTVRKEFSSHSYFDDAEKQKAVHSLFDNINVSDIFEMIDEEDDTLSFLFDVLPIDVWIKDKYGRYVFVNRSFLKNTQFEKDHVLYKDDYELFDKRTAKNFVESDYIAIDSKKPLHYIFEAKESSLPLFTDVTKTPLYNDDSEYIGLMGFSVDVTETKQLQVKKEDEFRTLHHLLKHFNGIIFETDGIGNQYYINGKLIQNLSNKRLSGVNMYEIFEHLGIKVKSIQDINAVIVKNKTKILSMHSGVKLKLEAIPFETVDGEMHKLCVGTVIEDEEE